MPCLFFRERQWGKNEIIKARSLFSKMHQVQLLDCRGAHTSLEGEASREVFKWILGMNAKEKAEQYVRQQLPELMELSFGCEVRVKNGLYIREFNLYPPLHVNNDFKVVNRTSYIKVPEFKMWVDRGDAYAPFPAH